MKKKATAKKNKTVKVGNLIVRKNCYDHDCFVVDCDVCHIHDEPADENGRCITCDTKHLLDKGASLCSGDKQAAAAPLDEVNCPECLRIKAQLLLEKVASISESMD